MENAMETGGIEGSKELNSSYSIGETLSISIYIYNTYTHYGNLVYIT